MDRRHSVSESLTSPVRDGHYRATVRALYHVLLEAGFSTALFKETFLLLKTIICLFMIDSYITDIAFPS